MALTETKLESLLHSLIALAIIISATVLCAGGQLDQSAWASACGVAIVTSGAVGVINTKTAVQTQKEGSSNG